MFIYIKVISVLAPTYFDRPSLRCYFLSESDLEMILEELQKQRFSKVFRGCSNGTSG